MGHPFAIADVFAPGAFGGNPLAVVTDASGLDAGQMQAVAAEFGFAETTFVLPPDRPASTARVRIFTPRLELRFAGHPTVGTAAVLADLGRVAVPGQAVLDEGVGPVGVSVERGAGGALRAELRLERPELQGAPPGPVRVAAVAAALGAAPIDVLEVVDAGVGTSFTLARVSSVEVLDALAPEAAAVAALEGPRGVFAYAGEPAEGAQLHARMWAPAMGIAEDPATGSAVAALVAVAAVRAAGPGGDAEVAFGVEQGRVMGRPSLLAASATVAGGVLVEVRVGGDVVIVADGTLRVP